MLVATVDVSSSINGDSKFQGNVSETGTISANIESRTATLSFGIDIPKTIDRPAFEEEYEYTPTFEEQVLPTANRYLKADITINSIQTYETSNDAGGITLVI